MKKSLSCLLILIASHLSMAQLPWPEITTTAKPWTRWWWHGSAVNAIDLKNQLTTFRDAGLGGVEITPIYGVVGQEEKYISYLTPAWMEILTNTLKIAGELGLGVDMANGTGWPFGGPWVTDQLASATLFHKLYVMTSGRPLEEKIQFHQKSFVRTANNKALTASAINLPVQTNHDLQKLSIDQVQFDTILKPFLVMAYGPGGVTINLTSKTDSSGHLQWEAPGDQWKVIALFKGLHGKFVERAAPGGEGYAIDHFSDISTREYLKHFDKAFKGYDLSYLRAFFNDSYEVDDARGQSNWTEKFLEEFSTRRGYDLRNHLPALFGTDSSLHQSKVLYDYRSVIDELILEHFTRYWKSWAATKGKMVRNQSHGSPANTLDLYGAVDIPETEGNDILRFKFASSAGNVMGKPLVSAEAATWLDEHFLANWAAVRKAADLFFLGGVNHLFYHGTAYSPQSASWPGWLFYAAVHFQPTNPMWKHFSTLNQYISRVQSFLQSSKPDNDLLVYYPIADQYAKPGNFTLQHFDGMEKNFEQTDFLHSSEWLMENGYSFDFFSSRQLHAFRFDKTLLTGGNRYQAIMVTAARYMQPEELSSLLQLARAGATVLFYKHLPVSVPGFHQYKERQLLLDSLKAIINFKQDDNIKTATIGKGRFIMSDDLGSLLTAASVRKERLHSFGLSFIRKVNANGNFYFLNNNSDKPVREWVSFASVTAGKAMAIFDPATGNSGIAAERKGAHGSSEFFLQLEPGESVIFQVYRTGKRYPPYPYYREIGMPVTLNKTWTTRFTDGGPTLPRNYTSAGPLLWTKSPDSAALSYSGLAIYSTTVALPGSSARFWKLNLGKVHETAEIKINDKHIQTLIGPVYSIVIPSSAFTGKNKLEIVVANKMANRIRYMDLNKLPWKYYYNINMPARRKENSVNGLFDASNWQPEPSGLGGPVTLTPMELINQ